jgi:hypothetical protein
MGVDAELQTKSGIRKRQCRGFCDVGTVWDGSIERL